MMAPYPQIRRRLVALGIPRLKLSTFSHDKRVVRRMEAQVDALIADHQVAVLRALADGTITLPMLDDFARSAPLTGAGLTVLVRGVVPLSEALDTIFPDETSRYRLSFRRVLAVAPTATVRDLGSLDWGVIVDACTSVADAWHLRRALSRFLTLWYGGKHVQARHDILASFPALPQEPERTPGLTPDVFAAIVQAARADLRAPLVTLAATGLRIGEYLRLTPAHLDHATQTIRVPGTKTYRSAAPIAVDPALWPIVVAAVPSPLRYRRFHAEWRAALFVAGVGPEHRIHDLRHAHGQWAIDGGAAERDVQRSLRHTNSAQTRRYTMKDDTLRVSSSLMASLNPVLQLLERDT
jgi:integrase